jgi:hypothetical protein
VALNDPNGDAPERGGYDHMYNDVYMERDRFTSRALSESTMHRDGRDVRSNWSNGLAFGGWTGTGYNEGVVNHALSGGDLSGLAEGHYVNNGDDTFGYYRVTETYWKSDNTTRITGKFHNGDMTVHGKRDILIIKTNQGFDRYLAEMLNTDISEYINYDAFDVQVGGDLGLLTYFGPAGAAKLTMVGLRGTYRAMKLITKGHKGLIQAHYIVEVRHLKVLGLSVLDAPSIVLTKTFHQQVTKNLMTLLPKGVTYTKSQIMSAYRQAYKEYPDWIKSAEKYLGL